MKKQSVITLLLFLVLINLGCTMGEPRRQDVDIHTGTQGLVLRFLPQTPPEIAYGEEDIDIQIEVSNKGAYTTNGLLYLTGFDKSIIEVGTNSVTIDSTPGKDEFLREGGKNVIAIPNIRVGLPPGVDKYPTKIEAIACYTYKTMATIPICIDGNPRIDTHDSCKPTNVGGGSQGAPVAVSNVQVESGHGKLRLVLTINNVGNGIIINQDGSSCPFGYEYGVLGNIEGFEAYLGKENGPIDLQCNPTSNIKIAGGSAKVYCQANVNSETAAYITPLTVNFDYGYKNAISTPIEIRRGI